MKLIMLHFKLLEKQAQVKPETSRRKEIIKVSAKNQQNRDQENHIKKQ
jgi:hypothetical protein